MESINIVTCRFMRSPVDGHAVPDLVLDDLPAQSMDQRIILAFRVSDNNIIFRDKKGVYNLSFCSLCCLAP